MARKATDRQTETPSEILWAADGVVGAVAGAV